MSFKIAVLALVGLAAFGCTGNPTNAPSVEEAKAADVSRVKAIDDNPNLTAEQKANMKAHMNGGKGPL